MHEYIILTILLTLLISSFVYLIKAMKSLTTEENSIILESTPYLKKELLIKNNLDELEFDLMSQKLDKEEYDKLKETMLNGLNLINKLNNIQVNKSDFTQTSDKEYKKLICTNCKKELEADSKFCKYCGNKVNF